VLPANSEKLKKKLTLRFRSCTSLQDIVLGSYVCNGVAECKKQQDEISCPNRFFCDAGSAESLITGWLLLRSHLCSIRFYYNHVDGKVNALNSIYMNEVGNRAGFKSVPSPRGGWCA